jgi:hypothetical protein
MRNKREADASFASTSGQTSAKILRNLKKVLLEFKVSVLYWMSKSHTEIEC